MAEPGAIESSVDEEIARIAGRIRRWREEAGLTLQELGERSGLATSTVQKVETAQMIPSVAVLLKLGHGLGRRPAELIHDGDAAEDVVHLRAGERDRGGREGSILTERLSGDLLDPSLEMWRVTLWPGASSGDAIQYDGEELVSCESGRVRFRISGRDIDLDEGDSLHFKAHLAHAWSNQSDEPACFTVVGTLPAKFRALLRSRMRD